MRRRLRKCGWRPGGWNLWTRVFPRCRAANEQATLLINDYRVDPPYAQLITEMTEKAGRRPYDVIGIQSHMHGDVWTNEKLWEVCQRFATFGVPLHFTELTVLSGKKGWELARQGNSWPSTSEGEEQQAQDVTRIYTMLFSHPSVTAITWWDFADRNAWQRAPAGLIGQDLSPKPAYTALRQLVKNDWWTRIEQKTDAAGRLSFRGFLGDYVVKVRFASGKEQEVPLTLTKDRSNEKRIVVQATRLP